MGELVTLSWQSHARRLIEGIWTNLQSKLSTDFEICVSENKSIKAHHVILSIFCPSLINLIDKKISLDEQLGLSTDDLNDIIEFIYRGKIRVKEDRLSCLKAGASAIGLSILAEVIDNLIGSKTPITAEQAAETNGNVLPAKRKRKLTEAGMLHKESLTAKRRTSVEVNQAVERPRRKAKELPSKSSETRPAAGPSVSTTAVKSPYVKLEKLPAIRTGKSLDESKTVVKQRVVLLPTSKQKVISKEKHLERLKNMLKNLSDGEKKQGENEEGEKVDGEVAEVSPTSDVEMRHETQDTGDVTSKTNPSRKKADKTKDSEIYLSPWLKQKIIELGDEQTAVYRYNCEICGQLLIGFFRQLRHLQCHENPDLILKCEHCPFQAEMEADMNRHLSTVHELDSKGQPLPKNVKCTDCDFTCIRKSQLRAHQSTAHRCLRYKCEECEERFHYRLSLVQHQFSAHATKTPLLCDNCGFSTDVMTDFKQHLKEHSLGVLPTELAPYEEEVSQVFEIPQELVADTTTTQVIVVPHELLVPQETVPHTQTLVMPVKTGKEISCHLCTFTASIPFSLKFHLKTLHKLPANEVLEIIKKFEMPSGH